MAKGNRERVILDQDKGHIGVQIGQDQGHIGGIIKILKGQDEGQYGSGKPTKDHLGSR